MSTHEDRPSVAVGGTEPGPEGDTAREAIAEALARRLCPDHFSPAYRYELQRAGVPVPDPADTACMTTFDADDGFRTLKCLTFGEIADALLAAGYRPDSGSGGPS